MSLSILLKCGSVCVRSVLYYFGICDRIRISNLYPDFETVVDDGIQLCIKLQRIQRRDSTTIHATPAHFLSLLYLLKVCHWLAMQQPERIPLGNANMLTRHRALLFLHH